MTAAENPKTVDVDLVGVRRARRFLRWMGLCPVQAKDSAPADSLARGRRGAGAAEKAQSEAQLSVLAAAAQMGGCRL